MTWLTWRQSRAQMVAAGAALAVIAIIVAVTGPGLARLYGTSGAATCQAHDNCGTAVTAFLNELSKSTVVLYFAGVAVMFLVPAMIGAFWGAPLVTREIEARTLPLAWNQTVTRTRWLTVKLGTGVLTAMATAALLSLMLTWWSGPLDAALAVPDGGRIALTRFSALLFATRGITPAGYAAFSFVVGVAAGVLIRRTVPAMATTLASFTVIQFIWANWIRSHLIAPLHTVARLSPANISLVKVTNNSMAIFVTPSSGQQGAWVLSSEIADRTGQPFHGAPPAGCPVNLHQCAAGIGSLHLRQLITYLPASRYWTLQWYETAIFLAATVALAAFCAWRVAASSSSRPASRSACRDDRVTAGRCRYDWTGRLAAAIRAVVVGAPARKRSSGCSNNDSRVS